MGRGQGWGGVEETGGGAYSRQHCCFEQWGPYLAQFVCVVRLSRVRDLCRSAWRVLGMPRSNRLSCPCDHVARRAGNAGAAASVGRRTGPFATRGSVERESRCVGTKSSSAARSGLGASGSTPRGTVGLSLCSHTDTVGVAKSYTTKNYLQHTPTRPVDAQRRSSATTNLEFTNFAGSALSAPYVANVNGPIRS